MLRVSSFPVLCALESDADGSVVIGEFRHF